MEQAWCAELSEAIANNGVPLNEHPVADFHARWVEASSVGLCRRCRRTFWTLLIWSLLPK